MKTVRYSFTTALPKYIVSKLTKIWLFYIILSLGMIYAAGLYLNAEKSTLFNNARLTEDDIALRDDDIAKIQADIDRLNFETELNASNRRYNAELQGALLKLFGLIPDQITITYMHLEEKRLVLKGITPTREIYSFLLQAPLRSIFTTSRVDFYPLSNGWYNFTSVSVLEDS